MRNTNLFRLIVGGLGLAGLVLGLFLASAVVGNRQALADPGFIESNAQVLEGKAVGQLVSAGIPVNDVTLKIQMMINNISRALDAAKQLAVIKEIIEIITFINDLLDLMLNKIEDAIKTVGKLQIEAARAQTKVMTKTANFISDSIVATSRINSQASYIRDRTESPQAPSQVCRKVKLEQLKPDARVVTAWVSDAESKAIMQEYKMIDAGGPEWAREHLKNRRGSATGGKSGFVSVIDNSKKGQPNTGTEEQKAKLEDADLSFTTLRASVLDEPLELPKLVNQVATINGQKLTYTMAEPDPGKYGQMRYVAARDYCRTMAGPHPQPPLGKEQDTPNGMTKTALYNHCVALQSAYIKQCTDRLAYITRPNCKDDPGQFKDYCIKTQEICVMAQGKDGVQLPKTIDCEKGLSAFQIDYIRHLHCQTNKVFENKSANGAKANDMIRDSDLCALGMMTWEAQLAQEEGNVLSAVLGMHELKDCWAQLER